MRSSAEGNGQSREVRWPQLMNEALTMEPGQMTTYSRFHNYSFGNCVLLLMQGVNEPVAGMKKWNELGRRVKKGSRAKSIMIPMTRNVENDKGEVERRISGFRLMNRVFPVSDTEGDPLPEVEPREWSKERALGALAIREVPFEGLNGNVQGYSVDRDIAINQVAAWPEKTLKHEMAHVVLGHTALEQYAEYLAHRGVKEFQAEATAYIVMNELGLTEHMDAAESRGYIAGWLEGRTPEDKDIRGVFSAVDKILKAGRIEESPQTVVE